MIGPDLHFTPRGLYIGGQWQQAADGGRLETINPSDHPFRFCAEKAAAALAAGNTVVVKCPEQAQGTAVRPGIELPPLSPPSGPIKLVSTNARNVTSGDCSL
jgi:acyl-CoA reductase-like NAD-dependent aldehyde dehydrogenase